MESVRLNLPFYFLENYILDIILWINGYFLQWLLSSIIRRIAIGNITGIFDLAQKRQDSIGKSRKYIFDLRRDFL